MVRAWGSAAGRSMHGTGLGEAKVMEHTVREFDWQSEHHTLTPRTYNPTW